MLAAFLTASDCGLPWTLFKCLSWVPGKKVWAWQLLVKYWDAILKTGCMLGSGSWGSRPRQRLACRKCAGRSWDQQSWAYDRSRMRHMEEPKDSKGLNWSRESTGVQRTLQSCSIWRKAGLCIPLAVYWPLGGRGASLQLNYYQRWKQLRASAASTPSSRRNGVSTLGWGGGRSDSTHMP